MDPHSPGPADRAKPIEAALARGAPRRLAYNKDGYAFLLRITKTADLLGGKGGGVGSSLLFVFSPPKHWFLQHLFL